MNNECDELRKPITYLLTLQAEQPAAIINYRANFYYSIGNENKIHEYHYENKDVLPINNSCDLNLNAITSYDDSTKEVTTNLIGNKGFYIPTRSAGYYEIVVQISQNNNVQTYCFHNNFSFTSETYYDRTINIKSIVIDSLNNNFKRMTF
jgi:DNA replicative helicase MCM subunit Mcm2 (Cdc46/Mcm family)